MKPQILAKLSSGTIPLVSKEIVEVKALDLDLGKIEGERREVEIGGGDLRKEVEAEGIKVEGRGRGRRKRGEENDDVPVVKSPNIGWGRWYSLEELRIATRGFADENVIGEGGYGIVYRGVLQDGSVVAVKNLLNNKYVFVFIFWD